MWLCKALYHWLPPFLYRSFSLTTPLNGNKVVSEQRSLCESLMEKHEASVKRCVGGDNPVKCGAEMLGSSKHSSTSHRRSEHGFHVAFDSTAAANALDAAASGE